MSQYIRLKFRNFCGRDREGFVLFSNERLPEIILQDILFQLFSNLYPHILCPQAYYFTHGQEVVDYKNLESVDGFIYVHFMERVSKYKTAGKLQQPFKICNLNKIAQGIKINTCRLFIFSEKQYAIYANRKYCEIVKQRITDLNNIYDRLLMSNEELTDILSELNGRMDNEEGKFGNFSKQFQQFHSSQFQIDKMMMDLSKADAQLTRILRETGINLQSLSVLLS